jgi:hypothetical protein
LVGHPMCPPIEEKPLYPSCKDFRVDVFQFYA